MARVLVVEPFYGGSHRDFLDGLVRHSRHKFSLLTLPGVDWRRRMRRGAQELAPLAKAVPGEFDLVIATDMLDLPTFLALTRQRFATTPILCYFHENQFTYPRIRGTKFNSWFGQVNYLSACAADYVAFNSAFHRQDFMRALRALDETPNSWLLSSSIDRVASESFVLPVGVDLQWLDVYRRSPDADASPLILWNHRWEFDKAPAVFARAVRQLADEGVDFRLALAGDPGPNPDASLVQLADEMHARGRVTHRGFADSRAQFAGLLWASDIVVSTARHEFFGVGMVEALYCCCRPISPDGYNYPALIPEAWHEDALFADPGELVEKLRAELARPRQRSTAGRDAVRRYDWSTVGPVWDEAISAMAERRAIAMPDASIDQVCDAGITAHRE